MLSRIRPIMLTVFKVGITLLTSALTFLYRLMQMILHAWRTRSRQPINNPLYSAHLTRWYIQQALKWMFLAGVIPCLGLALQVATHNPFASFTRQYYYGSRGSPVLVVCCTLIAITFVQVFRLLNAKTRPLDE